MRPFVALLVIAGSLGAAVSSADAQRYRDWDDWEDAREDARERYEDWLEDRRERYEDLLEEREDRRREARRQWERDQRHWARPQRFGRTYYVPRYSRYGDRAWWYEDRYTWNPRYRDYSYHAPAPYYDDYYYYDGRRYRRARVGGDIGSHIGGWLGGHEGAAIGRQLGAEIGARID